MAVLSDDTLSDDDALGARHGGGLPFVFGWANNMARWGQQDLDDTDAAVADAYPTLRKLDMGYALLTDADLTFLPSLPELTDLGITLTNLPKSTIDDVAKRCPKLINLPRY